MLIEQYFNALQAKIAEIAAQPEPIQQAAKICADALEKGGVIHIFDSGHMVSSELIHRAGGLAAPGEAYGNQSYLQKTVQSQRIHVYG